MKGDLDAAYPHTEEDPSRYGRVCIVFDIKTGDLDYTSNLGGPFLVGVLSMAAMLVKDDTYGESEKGETK